MSAVTALARHGLEEAAPSLLAYLRRQRWYGSRGRAVAGFEIEDVASCSATPRRRCCWCSRIIAYEDGGRERYSLPLGIRPGPPPASSTPREWSPRSTATPVRRRWSTPSATPS